MGTAGWIAAVRARESRRTDRLFDDPYAEALAGTAGFAMMERSEAAVGSENAMIPVRVRWFDDTVRSVVADGVDQVVLLGAGLDTRPYRLTLPSTVDWYEVDRAGVFDAKARVLGNAQPSCRTHAVVADLAGEWTVGLREAGFDPARRTAWVAEGLMFYLAEESVDDLLRQTIASSPTGSVFVADIVGRTGLDGPAMRGYLDYCASNGLPPPFGLDDPTELFTRNDWHPDRITSAGGPDANFGRLPIQPAGVRRANTHFVLARHR